MTQDEIMEMARPFLWGGNVVEGWTFSSYEQLERFAKLVAEKEREACWQIACDYTQKFNSHTCLAVADEIRARGQA